MHWMNHTRFIVKVTLLTSSITDQYRPLPCTHVLYIDDNGCHTILSYGILIIASVLIIWVHTELKPL